MGYFQIFSTISAMYMVCISPTAVRMRKDLPDNGTPLWKVTSVTEYGGSTICCKEFDSCITLDNRRPATYEPLVLKPRADDYGHLYIWKFFNTNQTNAVNVVTMDEKFTWNLHSKGYVDGMPIQLYLWDQAANARFQFIPAN